MTPLISEIQSAVCAYFGTPMVELLSDRRGLEIARPRQIAYYLSRQFTPLSYPQIGRKFGNRDHATIIHGVKRVEQLMPFDRELENDVQCIRDDINTMLKAKAASFGDGVSGD